MNAPRHLSHTRSLLATAVAVPAMLIGVGVFAPSAQGKTLPAPIGGGGDPPSVCDAIAGNLVQNCGFETGSLTDWTQSGNTGNALIVSGDPRFVNSGTYGIEAGPVGSDGFISQTLSTTAGTTYTISAFYDPSGATPSDFDIEWNGTTLLNIVNDTNGWGTNGGVPQWVNETVTAVGTGSDMLTISFRDDPSFAGIDDISVVATTAPVPAPLIGFGLPAFLAVGGVWFGALFLQGGMIRGSSSAPSV